MLHLAADRLEVADLVTGHSTNVGAVKHDDRPARVRRSGLVRLFPDSRDLRRRLPVSRLELQGNGMGADAQATVLHKLGMRAQLPQPLLWFRQYGRRSGLPSPAACG